MAPHPPCPQGRLDEGAEARLRLPRLRGGGAPGRRRRWRVDGHDHSGPQDRSPARRTPRPALGRCGPGRRQAHGEAGDRSGHRGDPQERQAPRGASQHRSTEGLQGPAAPEGPARLLRPGRQVPGQRGVQVAALAGREEGGAPPYRLACTPAYIRLSPCYEGGPPQGGPGAARPRDHRDDHALCPPGPSGQEGGGRDLGPARELWAPDGHQGP